MDKTKQREEFEAWFRSKHVGQMITKGSGYSNLITQLMWQAWQAAQKAALASIEIELSADDIKKVFLENGFKEKIQADGSLDLNSYVYDAAVALLELAKGLRVKS